METNKQPRLVVHLTGQARKSQTGGNAQGSVGHTGGNKNRRVVANALLVRPQQAREGKIGDLACHERGRRHIVSPS